MNTKLRYFSYQGCYSSEYLRENCPPADTKIDYIINVLNRIGISVEHISHISGSNSIFFLPSRKINKGQNTFYYFASFKNFKTPLLRFLNTKFIEIQFFIWCMLHLHRGEQVLVYHSMGYDKTFQILKKIKKIKLIGDIEEIYQDMLPFKKRYKKNEYDFIAACDKFMFPNTLLNERLNKEGKPSLIVHGIYKVDNFEKGLSADKFIDILYAGTFHPIKGGAIAAVQAAKYLPSNYRLHISGSSCAEHLQLVKDEIEKINPLTHAQIILHGYLNNEEFIDMMRSCSIGLCTQDPSCFYNLTSFPSKIVNYMANGLVVVAGRNRAVEESAVGDLIYYYNNQDPKEIAETILKIKNIDYQNCIRRVNDLDIRFCIELKKLLLND